MLSDFDSQLAKLSDHLAMHSTPEKTLRHETQKVLYNKHKKLGICSMTLQLIIYQ